MTRSSSLRIFYVVTAMAVSFSHASQVIDQSRVGFGWAAHQTSPPILVTSGNHQYLAYYDSTRRLTLAWRKLDEGAWKQRQFPVVTRWATGAHAQIALAVDADGIIHLVPYHRDLTESPPSPPDILYFRSMRKHDPESMERSYMVSPKEPHPHYPLFLRAADGGLFFESRIGGSGKGNQMLYQYDRETGKWHRLCTLLDGQGRMSAYGGPRLGPDGLWHCLWMWRDTPDAETNHTLSYIVSPDLVCWMNAAGQPLRIPICPEHSTVVVDPAKPGGGMINPLKFLGFDRKMQPVITYHKYAPCGNSAIYNARFENGTWKSVAAHILGFRWEFSGRGALDMEVRTGPVKIAKDGTLIQRVWSKREGAKYVIVHEQTLEPLRETETAQIPLDHPWQQEFSNPEVDFPQRPLSVTWLAGQGDSAESRERYWVRWEHGPLNAGDRPVPEPWPAGAPIRVFKIRD